MRLGLISNCILLLILHEACLAVENNATRKGDAQENPIEVRFVDGLFAISDGKPNKWEDIQSALEAHRKANPGARYEFISGGKLPIDTCLAILGYAERAGISFEHFWVPQGDIDEEEKTGKHGRGIIDIIKILQAEAIKIKRVDKAVVDSQSNDGAKSAVPAIKKE